MALNKANINHFLKRVYPRKVLDEQSDKVGKLLAMMPRNSRGFGESYDVGIEYGRLVSSGADFTKTQTLASSTAPQGKKFANAEVTHYTLARITGNVVRKARAGNDGMFKEALTSKGRKVFATEVHRMSRAIYEAGYGVIGQVGSITNGDATNDLIVLKYRQDVINFDEDMVIGLVINTGKSAAMRDSGDTTTVARVDRALGYVYCDDNVVTKINGAAPDDYIAIDGDRGTGATPTKIMPDGLEAWVPPTAPGGSDSFKGINRSSDVTRLAGWRLGAKNKTVRESFMEGPYLVQEDITSFMTIFTNPARFKELALDIESSKVFHREVFQSAVAKIGIKGAVIEHEMGELRVIPDPYCPYAYSWGLDLSYWELRSEGPWPDFLTFDDGNMITVDAADQAEIRGGGDMNMVCRNPGAQIIFDHLTNG